jgi:hypothetical protein
LDPNPTRAIFAQLPGADKRACGRAEDNISSAGPARQNFCAYDRELANSIWFPMAVSRTLFLFTSCLLFPPPPFSDLNLKQAISFVAFYCLWVFLFSFFFPKKALAFSASWSLRVGCHSCIIDSIRIHDHSEEIFHSPKDTAAVWLGPQSWALVRLN